MRSKNWLLPSKVLPERGQKVDWIDHGGEEVLGGTYDGVWFLPDGMYIYYVPMFWRPAEVQKKEGD